MAEPYTKTRTGNVLGHLHYVVHDINATVNLDQVASYAFAAYVDTVTGVKNPRWRDQVRQGQNATTPFTGTKVTFDQDWLSYTCDSFFVQNPPQPPNVWQRYRTLDGRWTPLSGIAWPGDPPAAVVTRVTNRCIGKFLDAYDNARSSIEAGQDLGEYRETLHTLMKPMHSMFQKTVHYLNVLMKVRQTVHHPPTLRKVLADTYLEYHFGIKPLALDVAAAIADAKRSRLDIVRISASASERYNVTIANRVTDPPLGGAPGFTWATQSYGEFKCRMLGGIRSDADPDGKISLGQAWQLYPDKWVPTAWDLLPFSWLVDEFVNVGEIYRGLSFLSSKLAWGCKTTRTVYARNWRLVSCSPAPSPGPGWTQVRREADVQGGNGYQNTTVVNRSVLGTDDLLPRVQFSIPTSKYPYFNIAAVLSQRIRKLTPFF